MIVFEQLKYLTALIPIGKLFPTYPGDRFLKTDRVSFSLIFMNHFKEKITHMMFTEARCFFFGSDIYLIVCKKHDGKHFSRAHGMLFLTH